MIYRRFLTIALGCTALAAGAAPGSDEAVLGANAAYRAGDPDRLARHAKALSGHVLEPWAEYWGLRLRLYEAKATEVRRYLERHAGTYLAEQLRADWLKELGRRGDWQRFEGELGPLVQDELEIRCYAWRARLARGDADAREEARALWLEPRELPEGCVPLGERLVKEGAIGEERAWQRVRLLLANGQVSAARRALGALPAAEQPEERLLTQAATAPKRLLARPPQTLERRAAREMLLFAALRLARSDLRAAAEALEGLGERLPQEEREYLWAQLAMLASIEFDDDALAWYARAGATRLSDEQLAWKARAALRAGRWQTVREAIEPMSALARQDMAWTYWHGRALGALGDAEGARAQYMRIAGQPLYYSVLATEELGGEANIPTPHHEPTEDEVDEARRNVELARALELFRLGLRTEATNEWIFAVRNMDDARLLAAAELARRAGAYERAINTAGRTERRHDYRVRYPAPYRDVFREYALAYDLEEAWVLGMVRQESRFTHAARSGAGATGLMQLLPDTARWVARRIGYKGYSPRRAAEVETNVTLGSRYLRFVLDGFGHPVLATAAYNAGPSRARRWLPAQPMEGAVFVESIPFGETREYVKRVMANAVHYALLLEGRSVPLKRRLGTIPGRVAAARAEEDLP